MKKQLIVMTAFLCGVMSVASAKPHSHLEASVKTKKHAAHKMKKDPYREMRVRRQMEEQTKRMTEVAADRALKRYNVLEKQIDAREAEQEELVKKHNLKV